MVEIYILLLVIFILIGDASFIATKDIVLKRNKLQHIFIRNLKNDLETKHSGFDKQEETEILDAFNTLRLNVIPSAADMTELKWSDDLAELAKYWGDTCPFENHFGPKDCQKLYSQNVFISDTDDIADIINYWDIEKNVSYYFDTNSCKGVCKNYKMTVTAGFHSVGCSKSDCGSNNYTYVCNFYPPIKDLDSAPYKKGPSCSSCPYNERCDPNGNFCERTDRHIPLDEILACSEIECETKSIIPKKRINLFDDMIDEHVSVGFKPLNNATAMLLCLIEVIAMLFI